MRTFDGFFDVLGELDWLAIIVATIVVFAVLGFLVYGPLFGKKFAAATGGSTALKFEAKRDITALVMSFIFQIGVAYLGAFDDIEHSLVTALVVGILLIGPVLYSQVVYLKKNKTVFLYELIFNFLAIAVGGYVQGLMA
jgi:hypothetical protein